MTKFNVLENAGTDVVLSITSVEEKSDVDRNKNESDNESYVNENVLDTRRDLSDENSSETHEREELRENEECDSTNIRIDENATINSSDHSSHGGNICIANLSQSVIDNGIISLPHKPDQSEKNLNMDTHSVEEINLNENLERLECVQPPLEITDVANNMNLNDGEVSTNMHVINALVDNNTESDAPSISSLIPNVVVTVNEDHINEGNMRRNISESNNGSSINNTTNMDENNGNHNNNRENIPIGIGDIDRNGQARTRWIRINQRFQILLTLVTLFFSILLFCILVCWVVFTSAFVMSIDHVCDVKLKMYFWLATMQLILDLFRSDIMLYVLRWDSRARNFPPRVVLYNLCYLVYAVMVLRLGMKSVFFSPESSCSRTAPELYQTAAVFISLSLGVWFTIVFGYAIPFICVIVILTRNGYAPTSDMPAWGNVFPSANRGAPEGTVDLLKIISYEETTEVECCICMDEFQPGDIIVTTDCKHVFHRKCCQEWLLNSRTCPVCRTDLANPTSISPNNNSSPLDHELVSIEEGIAIEPNTNNDRRT